MTSQPVHLLVMIHGMWGNPTHLNSLHRILRERRLDDPSSPAGPGGERFDVLIAETNKDESTYDGIDWGGERVTEEIFERIKQLKEEGKTVTRFSILGYSLGGLIARYVIGILYEKKFFETVTPVNFNTIASPHIGLIRYRSSFSRLAFFLGPNLLSRTGEQFYVVDKWSPRGRPLLEVMADPERIFLKALLLFQHVRIYANAVNDMTVPYPTAAIEHDDIFVDHETKGIEVEFQEEYTPLLKSYKWSEQSPDSGSVPFYKRLPRPIVPMPLRFNFPWNIPVYIFLPILFPLFLGLAITRLTLDSRKSRKRIQLLEKDESYTQRLVHVLGRLERQVEDVVVDMIDAPGDVAPSSASTLAPSPSPANDANASLSKSHDAEAATTQETPTINLSPLQHKIANWLNSVPQLQKELAWINPTRNSHAVIIARDIKKFPFQVIGEGVIKHWVDHLLA